MARTRVLLDDVELKRKKRSNVPAGQSQMRVGGWMAGNDDVIAARNKVGERAEGSRSEKEQ